MVRQRETSHAVTREKSCAILNFARFDSLVCIVARSQEKSFARPVSCSRLQVYIYQ